MHGMTEEQLEFEQQIQEEINQFPETEIIDIVVDQEGNELGEINHTYPENSTYHPELNTLETMKDNEYYSSHRAPVEINGHSIFCLVDSGANTSFISKRFVEQHGMKIMPASEGSYLNRAGTLDQRIGTTTVKLSWAEKKFSTDLEVIDHDTEDLIIGRDLFKTLGVTLNGIPVKPPGPEVTTVDDFLPLLILCARIL